MHRLPFERNPFDPRQQEGEHDRLTELLDELTIGCLWEEQAPPFLGDLSEDLAAPAGLLLNHRLGYLIAEQTAQASDRANQLRGGTRRLGLPEEKVTKHPGQSRSLRRQSSAGLEDGAFHSGTLAKELAAAVQRELIPVAIQDVGKQPQLLPLGGAVPGEGRGICPASRPLQLDVPDERSVDRNRVVGPGSQVHEWDFTDQCDGEPPAVAQPA
ncbi:hypothetical protein [Streptomyces sp. NPDC051214]|uniref:hypothetical protein n=1 Tax=Streptomyces sp. NPDC051214 TaxID=3155282 RepID=UPI00341A0041